MNGAYALSISNIRRLLKDQWQLSFSTGAVSQATCSVTDWLQPLYQQIGDAVRDLPIAHADETSHYRNSERRWVLCSSQVVYFLTHYSRGKGVANGLCGLHSVNKKYYQLENHANLCTSSWLSS